MKQTAVEWLLSEIQRLPLEHRLEKQHLYMHALKMEKQQIEDAHIEGQRVFDKHTHTQWTNDQAEQYYNETYGSKGIDECQFEPTTNTSSATICKYCGREKFLHQ